MGQFPYAIPTAIGQPGKSKTAVNVGERRNRRTAQKAMSTFPAGTGSFTQTRVVENLSAEPLSSFDQGS